MASIVDANPETSMISAIWGCRVSLLSHQRRLAEADMIVRLPRPDHVYGGFGPVMVITSSDVFPVRSVHLAMAVIYSTQS